MKDRLFPRDPFFISCAALCLLVTCGIEDIIHAQAPAVEPASYVNPFVGTDRDGDTYPGAQAPFGMVQFNPDLEGQGYYYNQLTMHGFALTLMSGPGGSNGGTPFFTATTGNVQVDQAQYSYTYDHKDESASAGYYRVLMQPFGINAELTATTRCGMARFTFPAGQQANVLLPVSYANVPTFASKVDLVDDHTLTGQTSTKPFYGPDKPIVIYFAMMFDRPFARHGAWTQGRVSANSDHVEQTDEKTQVGFYVSYPAPSAPMVLNVRIGISYVSVEGAIHNLKTEMPENKFDDYHAQTVAAWNKELRLIEVQDTSELHKRIFYTALYHALLFPSIFDDVDGKYIGFDDVVRQVPEGHQHIYANYSGWDIYRSEWPLLTLIEPERAQDMAQSIVEMYKQRGYIDRWPQANRATAIMNGNPLTVCLVNIWNAGLRNFDVDKAYEGMLKASVPTSTNSHLGQYEPIEDHGGPWINADSNVSTAQEYDLSFAALGHLALQLNKPDDANFLLGRALEYRTLFNPETGFFQPRDAQGKWENPDNANEGYCEGNKWIYLWFVPEDIQGLVGLLGGSGAFEQKLDQFFADKHYDATNEPDLQAPYLYDYINRPWKTQKVVAETADQVFTDAPGGLANGGNDDLGEMSAWYILSQLGFYPVDPGLPYFETCTPRFPKATLHLGAGAGAKVFTIEAPEASPENIYIQSAALNGTPLIKPWFDEKEILSGGEWQVSVGPQPNLNWGANPFDRPYSLSTGLHYLPPDAVPVPLIPPVADAPLIWRYTTTQPGHDWMQPDFPDRDWQEAPGGFGTDDVGVKPRTSWTSEDIWMRTTFELKAVPSHAALAVYHDKGFEVYLNGILAARDLDYVHEYQLVKLLSPDAGEAVTLHVGQNVLALHVRHQASGGRHFADAILLEESLPEAK
jgi:predicted alpha-1,2-mannosidase